MIPAQYQYQETHNLLPLFKPRTRDPSSPSTEPHKIPPLIITSSHKEGWGYSTQLTRVAHNIVRTLTALNSQVTLKIYVARMVAVWKTNVVRMSN